MEKFQQNIRAILREAWPDWEPSFTLPPTADLGDLAIPCFDLAKMLKQAPAVVAGNV